MLCVDAYCLDLNKLAIEDKAVFESPRGLAELLLVVFMT